MLTHEADSKESHPFKSPQRSEAFHELDTIYGEVAMEDIDFTKAILYKMAFLSAVNFKGEFDLQFYEQVYYTTLELSQTLDAIYGIFCQEHGEPVI